MRFWKWMTSLILLVILTACYSPGPTPTFQPPQGGYPALEAAPFGAYPAPDATTPGYPAPDATSTAAQPTATPGARVFMTFRDFEIVPAELSIHVGATVVFLIESDSGARHQPFNADPPNVFEAPADLGNGGQWSHTFTEPGTVIIRCRYHEDMTATIVVMP